MIGQRFILAVMLCVMLVGCPSARESPQAAAGATFVSADCPSDVEVQLLVEHACGYLTVPEDRSLPHGPKLQLLVVTFTPPGAVRTDPVLVVGDEIGGVPNYGFLQAYAQRLQRVVYVLEQRGTKHSRPSLSCPGLGGAPRRPEARDRSSLRAFLAAVEMCHARLSAAGWDLSAFDVSAMAADVQDLRETLQIDTWDLTSSGSSSMVALEVMREDPHHVRAVLLDSPWFPPLHVGASAVGATGLVVRALFRACGAEPSCRAAFPGLPALWGKTIASMERRPLSARVGRTDMRIDASLFIRTLRAALATDDADLTMFPTILREASRGRLHADLSTLLAMIPSACMGYWLGCGTTSTAVALSALCDVRTTGSINGSGSGDGEAPTGIADAFAVDPYRKACARWATGASDATERSLAEPVVPVLLFSGALDPFYSPRATRALARSLPVSFTIDVPGANHEPMANDACALDIASTWLDRPTAPPPTPPCLAARPLAFATDG